MKGTNPAYLCAPCEQFLCEGRLAFLHRQVHSSPWRPEGGLQTALSQDPYCLLVCLGDKEEKGVWQMGEKGGLSGQCKPCECGQPQKRPSVSILLSQAQINQVQNRLHMATITSHHFPTYSPSPASLSFFWNSAFASLHSLVSGNPNSDGNRSSLNCSDASRGSNVGRWSIEITDNGRTFLLQIRSTRAKQPSYSPKPINCYSRLRECRVGVVDRDWVKRVSRIAAHVDDY